MRYSKITTTQIYADFQISRLEFDFPSIVYAPNQPIFGKMDTNVMDKIRSTARENSVLSSRRSRVQVSSVPHRE